MFMKAMATTSSTTTGSNGPSPNLAQPSISNGLPHHHHHHGGTGSSNGMTRYSPSINVPVSSLSHANSKLLSIKQQQQQKSHNGFLNYNPHNLGDNTLQSQNDFHTSSFIHFGSDHSPIIMNKSTNNFTFGSSTLRHSVNLPASSSSSTGNNFSTKQSFNASSSSSSPQQQPQNANLSGSTSSSLVKNSNVTLKTRRSGSISSLLPLKENQVTSSFNAHSPPASKSNGNSSGLSSKLKLNPIPQPKRRKSNSLSIIDYCNIMNMNTNFQMIANFYDDTEASMSRLSMKTTRNANIEKQASLSEQMAALFGSSMCTCCLCKLKILNLPKRSPTLTLQPPPPQSASTQQVAQPTSPGQVQQYNFELVPNKHNSDHSIIKYTYSTPYSQLSPLKLFNLMNTDCSIIFSNNSNNNDTAAAAPNQGVSENPGEPHASGPSQSSLPMQFSNNTPPIYDSRYLYLIDCRLNRKQFDKSRIHTAIHYSDLLDDVIYVSPPVDHYTLIVLYDKDGTFLTSTSTDLSSSTSLFNANSEASLASGQDLAARRSAADEPIKSSDDLISRVKAKLGCNPLKTFYILSGGFDQFQSSFPYMCSSTDVRSTVDRHKHLTIYPNCVIEDQIFIGSGIQAKNWKIIRDLKITHIVNCSIEHECVFKDDDIKYLHVKLEDTYEENIYKVLEKTILFMQEAYVKYYEELQQYEDNSHHQQENGSSSRVLLGSAKSNSSSFGHHYNINLSNKNNYNNSAKKPVQPRFLIHCNLGISRSSSILIAYLMAKYKICLYAAFNYVKDKRIQIAPNYSFLRQLKQFEETYGFIQITK